MVKNWKARLLLANMLVVFSAILAGCGPPNIDELESDGNINRLIKALDHKDPAVVGEAAEALGRIGDQSAVGPLSAKIHSSEYLSVKQAAVAALGQIGGTQAISQLLSELNNDNKDVRESASTALAQIGEPVIESLINLLSTTGKDRRAAATDALAQIGEPAVEQLIEVVKKNSVNTIEIDNAVQALIEIGDAAIEPLAAILEDENIHVRERAARTLEELGWQPSKDAAGAYYYIILDNWYKCAEIGAAAVDPLIAALQDEDDTVRENAAKALGSIGDERAVESLITALDDEWGGVQNEAAWALGLIGDPRAVEPLSAMLLDENFENKLPVVTALGELGVTQAVDPLLTMLDDEGDTVRTAALVSLGKIGRPLLLDLTSTLNELGAICSEGTSSAAVLPELFYPLIVLGKDGEVNEWTPVFLLRWEPNASRETQLIACIHETQTQIEKCEYGSFGLAGSITRYQQDFEIILRQAKTGAEIGRTEFTNTPEECPEDRVMGAPSVSYYGNALFPEWDAWLADYLP